MSTVPHINVCENTYTLISQDSGWVLQQDSSSCTYRKPAPRCQGLTGVRFQTNLLCVHSGLRLGYDFAWSLCSGHPGASAKCGSLKHPMRPWGSSANPVTFPSEAAYMLINGSCTSTTYLNHSPCSALLIAYILNTFFWISADSLLSLHVTAAIFG